MVCLLIDILCGTILTQSHKHCLTRRPSTIHKHWHMLSPVQTCNKLLSTAGNKLHVWTERATCRCNKLPVWATKSRTWRQVAQCWTCSTLSNLLPKQYNSPKQATSCMSGRGFNILQGSQQAVVNFRTKFLVNFKVSNVGNHYVLCTTNQS